MRFNPAWHHRRGLRKRGHDYSAPGAYYVTICARDVGAFPFGHVRDGCMQLNAIGNIVDACWRSIPEHFPGVRLDDHIVMPNHVHGIVVIPEIQSTPFVGTRHASSLKSRVPVATDALTRHSLRAIIGSFKSAVSKRINQFQGTPGATVWQERYHDHVIRDEASWERIRRYIRENPLRWGRTAR
jgi:REP element-mobilizing transposase RayT